MRIYLAILVHVYRVTKGTKGSLGEANQNPECIPISKNHNNQVRTRALSATGSSPVGVNPHPGAF